MDCPTKEILQDFVEGQLQQSQRSRLIEHIRSCGKCKHELEEIFALHNALTESVNHDTCLSFDTLDAYAKSTLDKKQESRIKTHIEFCKRCESFLWMLKASPKELEAWQADEQAAYQEFRAKNLGYDAAREAIRNLLPGKVEVFDQLWRSILTLVSDLKNKAVEHWPSFSGPGQLVGALGFAEQTDPETTATSVVLATTLYVSQQIADGEVELTPQATQVAVRQAAARFGAGKELQKRLIEIIPPLLAKFS